MGLNSHSENARQGSGCRTLRNPKVLARVSNGQREALRHYLGRKRASGVYKITQLLPAEGEAFQYRIKNVKEPHERIAKEYELRGA